MITLEQHHIAHAWIDVYGECACGKFSGGTVENHAKHFADTWREARTVRTAEELDALPIGTVAQEQEYRHTWIRHSGMWHCSCDGTDVEWSSREAFDELEGLPLIILWTPEDGASECEL